MNEIIKSGFIIFIFLVVLTFSLIFMYYILPKNYNIYPINIKEKFKIKNEKNNCKLLHINKPVKIEIENFIKSEKMINDPNTIIEIKDGSKYEINNNDNDYILTCFD